MGFFRKKKEEQKEEVKPTRIEDIFTTDQQGLKITRIARSFVDSEQCRSCRRRYKNGSMACGNVFYLKKYDSYFEVECHCFEKIKGKMHLLDDDGKYLCKKSCKVIPEKATKDNDSVTCAKCVQKMAYRWPFVTPRGWQIKVKKEKNENRTATQR